jgi:hypothetical protein
MNVWKLNTTRTSEARSKNGKRTDGVFTPTLALNTESVATFITTCYLRKASKEYKLNRSVEAIAKPPHFSVRAFLIG